MNCVQRRLMPLAPLRVSAALLAFCAFLQVMPCRAQNTNPYEAEISRLNVEWDNNRRTPKVRERIVELEAAVGAMLRERFEAGSRAWPTAATAYFFHNVFDTLKDERRTMVWRELLLLKSAQEGNIVGDYASVAWFYQLLADAHFSNPGAFEKALKLLDRTSEVNCDAGVAKSICALEIGGGALRAIGAPHTGLILQEAALERLEKRRDVDASRIVRLRLNIALGWWRDGVASRTSQHLRRLDEDLASGGARLIPDDLVALHALKAAVCESQLDFHCTGAELKAATAALAAAKPSGNLLELYYRGVDELKAVIIRLVRRQPCAECADRVAKGVGEYISYVTSGGSAAEPADPGFALILLKALPPGFMSAKERGRLIEAAVTNSLKLGTRAQERHSGIRSREERAVFAFLGRELSLDGAAANHHRALREFVKAPSLIFAARHVDGLLAHSVENTYDLGATNDFLSTVSNLAFYLHTIGATHAEHAVLQYLHAFYTKNFVNVPNPIRDTGKANLAVVLAPAWARLAQLSLASGDAGRALEFATEASATLSAKLAREWLLGEERAVAALRSLSQTVHDTVATLVSAAGRARRGRQSRLAYGHAFRLAQAASFSDTAALLQMTLYQRRIDAYGARQLADEVHRTEAEIEILVAMANEYGGMTPLGALQRKAVLDSRLASLKAMISTAHKGWEASSMRSVLRSPSEVAAKLEEDEVLVLTMTGKEESLVFLVGKDGELRTHRNGFGHAGLSDAVRSIRAGIVPYSGKFPDFPIASAFAFFRDFFGPLGSSLTQAKAIITVVSGPLEALPLGVLPTRDAGFAKLSADAARGRGVAWLVRKARVSRVPNVQSFISLREQSGQQAHLLSFLGVGDPVLAPTQVKARRASDFSGIVAAQGLADVEWLRRLSSLPETRDELGRLGQAFSRANVRLLLGEEATEAVLKKTDLSNYDVIAFATHGVVAGAAFDGSQPGIVLTPPLRASQADDGFLTMGEISALTLNASLVILSACDTATSDGRPQSDGLSGLARAFFGAGAKNLIATHWEIPSEPAVEITTRTVEEAKRTPGTTWSKALQAAQLALIDSVGPEYFAHPGSWAAFQVIGAR